MTSIPIDVVHEDTDVIVVNKAAGLVVHPRGGYPVGNPGQRAPGPVSRAGRGG